MKTTENQQRESSPRIGVALSSGGGRGVYAHTGFLLALENLGIPVNACAGCSAGALVGGIYASGTNLKHWVKTLANVQRHQFWRPDSMLKTLWQLTVLRGRGYTGLSDTKAAISFCRENLAVQTFEECIIPFYALAVSIGTGKKVLFSHGDLAPRIMASAAIPVMYRPVEIDGDLYCDGAIIDFVSTDAICCKHQLDVLFIHHVATRYEDSRNIGQIQREPWSWLGIIYRLLYRHHAWYLSNNLLSFLRCPCGCGAVIIVLQPELPNLSWPQVKGGEKVQTATKVQIENLLQPYVTALLTDPRTQLPCSNTDAVT